MDPEGKAFIRTLGSVGVTDDGGQTLLTKGKQLALVVYLSAAPNRSATRSLLVDYLWSDKTELAGRHSLSNALTEIRRALGASAVSSDGSAVRLSVRVACDRDHYLAAIVAGDHAAAVDAYGGDFLPDFAVPGCGKFEDWAERERSALRSAFLRCAEQEVKQCFNAARWRDAQRIARRARDADPRNERSWRLLLDSLISGGDSVEAAMEALRLQQTWYDEEQEPEPETVRLVTAVLGANTVAAVDQSNESSRGPRFMPDMVGRAAEFSALLHAWHHVGNPRGAHVHIEADAGFGKTRLLAEFRHRLRTLRVRFVSVSASIADRDLSYSLASEIAAPLSALRGARGISGDSAATLVALNPSLAATFDVRPDATTGEEALRRRSLALEELLAAVCEERPVALIIDDVHWSDSASEQMLLRLIRRARTLPCLIATASRPRSAVSLGTDQSSTVHLAPLNSLEITELLTSLGELPNEPWTDDFVEDLLNASHGVPLVVVETLAHLVDVGALCIADRLWRCVSRSHVRAVLTQGESLRLRAASLAPLDASIVYALAVLGSGGETDILSAVVSSARDTTDAALSRLERLGFVRRVDLSKWSCAHDEIAAAILNAGNGATGIPPQSRIASFHARIAEALLQHTGDATALRRAGAHAIAAQNEVLLGRAVQEWANLRRNKGDTRSARDQVRDFLGTASSDVDLTARLARFLPRDRTPVYAAVGLVGFAVVVGWAAMIRSPAPPPIPLSTVTLFARKANGDAWSTSVGLERDTIVKRGSRLDSLSEQGALLARPGARNEFAFTRNVTDSGEDDVFLADAHNVRRLTFSRGDDVVSDWSADGNSLLVSTGRWDPDWFTDIAIVDATSGAARPLVTARGVAEHAARWSPDGMHVAFLRHPMTTLAPDSYCVVMADGSDAHCAEVEGYPALNYIAAWRGSSHLLVVADSLRSERLIDVDLVTHQTTLADTRNGRYFVSPDGTWLLCECAEAGSNRRLLRLSRVADPTEVRTITVPGGGETKLASVVWEMTPRAKLSRLSIVPPAQAIPSGQPYALQVEGRSATGEAVPAPAVQWWSSDTALARVDTDGMLLARRGGAVTVRVSALGVPPESISVAISASTLHRVWEETWAASDSAWHRVRLFGDPLPVRVRSDRGWAFWNHGDGSFSSGAYSVANWTSVEGLSLVTTIHLPRSRPVWQSIQVGLVGDLPDARLATWDHRTGGPPVVVGAPKCVMSAPYAEGLLGAGLIAVSTETDSRVVPAPKELANGWVRVRLDAYADGGCGLTLDDRPVVIVRGNRSATPRRLLVHGQSVGTQALVGPVTIWRGGPNGPAARAP